MQITELTPSARARALESIRESLRQSLGQFPYEWSQPTVDYWTARLERLGWSEAEWRWLGFSCRGDGACFTARWGLDQEEEISWLPPLALRQALAIERATALLERPDQFAEASFQLRVLVRLETGRSHHIYPEIMSVSVEVDGADPDWGLIDLSEHTLHLVDQWGLALEAALTREVRGVAKAFFRDLEAAHDATFSDEGLLQMALDFAYEFTPTGRLLPEAIAA